MGVPTGHIAEKRPFEGIAHPRRPLFHPFSTLHRGLRVRSPGEIRYACVPQHPPFLTARPAKVRECSIYLVLYIPDAPRQCKSGSAFCVVGAGTATGGRREEMGDTGLMPVTLRAWCSQKRGENRESSRLHRQGQVWLLGYAASHTSRPWDRRSLFRTPRVPLA